MAFRIPDFGNPRYCSAQARSFSRIGRASDYRASSRFFAALSFAFPLQKGWIETRPVDREQFADQIECLRALRMVGLRFDELASDMGPAMYETKARVFCREGVVGAISVDQQRSVDPSGPQGDAQRSALPRWPRVGQHLVATQVRTARRAWRRSKSAGRATRAGSTAVVPAPTLRRVLLRSAPACASEFRKPRELAPSLAAPRPRPRGRAL